MIPFFRALYLDSNQGCYTTVAAALCEFEDDYLQPYWLPHWMLSTPLPVFEMMGPFIGYRATKARLPNDNGTAQKCLWKASEELTGCVYPSS